MKKFLSGRLVLLIGAVLCFACAQFSDSAADNHATTISNLQKVLYEKEALLNAKVDSLSRKAEYFSYDQLFAQQEKNYSTLFEKDGLILLVYENDTLKYWTNNSMAVENYISEVCLDDKIAQLRNGWFEVIRKPSRPKGNKVIVGLMLLKKEYPYQNQYLVNEFQVDFNLNKDIRVVHTDTSSNNQVRTKDGAYLCSLIFPEAEVDDTAGNLLVVSFFSLLAFILSLLYLKTECAALANKMGPYISALVFVGVCIGLRFLTIYAKFPGSIYELPMFGPNYYGDSSSFWLPSLGDFLVNALIAFYVTWYTSKTCSFDESFLKKIKLSKILTAFILLFAVFMLSRLLNNLFIGLIQNSKLTFNINDLFSLDVYSYIGILIIGLMLYSFFLATDKIVVIVRRFDLGTNIFALVFLSVILIYTLLSHVLGTRDLIMIGWPAILILLLLRLRKTPNSGFVFSGAVILVSLFSFAAVHIFTKYRDMKEQDNRKIFAEKLAAEQDPLAEHLFTEVEEKIRIDSTLLDPAKFNSPDFGKEFIEKYFSGYWEKYEVKVSVFDTMCIPLYNGSNLNRDNHQYFEETIQSIGIPTESGKCFYLNNASGKISYIAKIPLYKDKISKVRYADLYLELDSRFVSDEIGFPELLLDREIGINRALVNYSYAKYKHGTLINKFGKYPYSLSSNSFPGKIGGLEIVDTQDFNHVIFRPDKETLVVLTKKNEGVLGLITTFSYLFAFFSLLLLVSLLIRQASVGVRFSQISFKYRIQLLLVMIVLVSLILFGGGTIFYIQKQYDEKNRDIISEKTQSVLSEVENKLGNELALTNNYREYASYILKRFSNVFFTDINLYDLKGNLFASSRPRVFDVGLTSKKMDPESFLNIGIQQKTEFIHDENIGRLYYISAYVPVKNKDGLIVAFLNLPYFAKQNDLEKEISNFLVALINIYVLLFGLSIIVAIFISNYLTKPLKLIQEKLGKIKLGKTNEPIEWKQHDEIGSLVSEYNRMILELQKSAELLARSERESAWREMAKQVAHEIKNPLTPMKLSIQHMQRLINDGSANLEEKIQRISKTLIEQIETLSNIATEFSNFAVMPKANNETVNIKELIENSIRLFNPEHSGSDEAEVKFTNEINESTLVFADKDQLIRVFNNLIKNAIQSIPEGRKGNVDVMLTKKPARETGVQSDGNNVVTISVKDNGTGISDEVMDKIFVPNFTTKSTGMGLGLAMVKNIVEGCDGKIWFETKENEGSTFYVSLPELKD